MSMNKNWMKTYSIKAIQYIEQIEISEINIGLFGLKPRAFRALLQAKTPYIPTLFQFKD